MTIDNEERDTFAEKVESRNIAIRPAIETDSNGTDSPSAELGVPHLKPNSNTLIPQQLENDVYIEYNYKDLTYFVRISMHSETLFCTCCLKSLKVLSLVPVLSTPLLEREE